MKKLILFPLIALVALLSGCGWITDLISQGECYESTFEGVEGKFEGLYPGEETVLEVAFTNTGNCEWPTGTTLVINHAGETFWSSAPTTTEIRPGETQVFTVIVTAPVETGEYGVGVAPHLQQDPAGPILPGGEFTLKVSAPAPTPTPTPSPTPTPTPIPIGGDTGFWD